MKIFIISGSLVSGGAERVAVMWANGFVQRGYDTYLISNLFYETTYEVDDKVNLLNMVSNDSNKVFKWVSIISNIRKYIKQYRPDVIIGIAWNYSLIAKIMSIGKHIPIIATEHAAFERPKADPLPFFEYVTRFVLNKLYNYLTVLTEADKEYIGNRFKNVYVMPNPLYLKPLKIPVNKKKIILAAGRLDVWYTKGFDILINAWGKIADKYPGWILEIVGKNHYKGSITYLTKLAEDNGVIDRINFLGYRNDMENLYKQSSIFVLSSRYEGFGLVLIEAMSQGCACIAADHKGRQKEIIQNESEGIIYKPENIDALIIGLDKTISDGNYRISIQKNAIEASARFDIKRIIDRWETLLQDIIRD